MHKGWPVAQPVILCTVDAYSCADFATQDRALALFDYCMGRGFGAFSAASSPSALPNSLSNLLT
jgi:hypothetical protein